MESETDSEAGKPEPSKAETGGADSVPFAPVEPSAPPPSAPPPSAPPPSAPPFAPPPQAPGGVYQPPDVYGYPPYGYGYPNPQAPRGTNGMAIAALVLGICGFLFVTPVVGLVLGIVGLAAALALYLA